MAKSLRRSNRPKGYLLKRRDVLKGIGSIAAAWGAASLIGTRSSAAQSVRFVSPYTQAARSNAFKEAAAEFEKTHGIHVEMETLSWGKLYTRWTTSLAAHSLPDVMIAKNANYMAMWMAGASLPVDDVIADLGGEKAFIPGILEHNCRYQGKTIAVPHYTIAGLLIYRKDLLSEKGLKPPQTWDDALKVAAALTNAPKRYGWQQYYSPDDSSGVLWPLYSFMYSNGGEFFDKNGNVIFNRPENVEAVQFLTDLTKAGSSPESPTMNWDKDEWDVMGGDKSAMILESMFAFPELDRLVPPIANQLGAAPLPKAPKGRIAGMSAPASIALLKGKNPEGGKKWIRFLLEGDRYIKFLHTVPSGMLPVTEAATKSPKFWAHPFIQKHLVETRLQADIAARTPYPGTGNGMTPYFSVIEVTPTLSNMMAKILIKKMPVEQAVTEAHAELEKDIATMKASGPVKK